MILSALDIPLVLDDTVEWPRELPITSMNSIYSLLKETSRYTYYPEKISTFRIIRNPSGSS